MESPQKDTFKDPFRASETTFKGSCEDPKGSHTLNSDE